MASSRSLLVLRGVSPLSSFSEPPLLEATTGDLLDFYFIPDPRRDGSIIVSPGMSVISCLWRAADIRKCFTEPSMSRGLH